MMTIEQVLSKIYQEFPNLAWDTHPCGLTVANEDFQELRDCVIPAFNQFLTDKEIKGFSVGSLGGAGLVASLARVSLLYQFPTPLDNPKLAKINKVAKGIYVIYLINNRHNHWGPIAFKLMTNHDANHAPKGLFEKIRDEVFNELHWKKVTGSFSFKKMNDKHYDDCFKIYDPAQLDLKTLENDLICVLNATKTVLEKHREEILNWLNH